MSNDDLKIPLADFMKDADYEQRVNQIREMSPLPDEPIEFFRYLFRFAKEQRLHYDLLWARSKHYDDATRDANFAICDFHFAKVHDILVFIDKGMDALTSE